MEVFNFCAIREFRRPDGWRDRLWLLWHGWRPFYLNGWWAK